MDLLIHSPFIGGRPKSDSLISRVSQVSFITKSGGTSFDKLRTGYTYNASSQITAVDGGSTGSYLYNGMDERTHKTAASGWTDYIYLNGQPMAEQTSAGTWSDYIYANGKKIAKADTFDVRLPMQGWISTSSGSTKPRPI